MLLAQNRVGTDVPRLCVEDLLRDRLGLFELPATHEQCCKLKLRLGIVGIQGYGLVELPICRVGVLESQVGAAELMVRRGKPRIDLQRISELDYRFLILAGLEITLAAFQVLEFLFVRVRGTGNQQDRRCD